MNDQQQPAAYGSIAMADYWLTETEAGRVPPGDGIPLARAELARYSELTAKITAARDADVTEDREALARRTDRDTSFKAAALIRTGTLRGAVLRYLAEFGPTTDVQLTRGLGKQGSGVRTRRAELVETGHVYATGETRKIGGHEHSIWAATAEGHAWVTRNVDTTQAA